MAVSMEHYRVFYQVARCGNITQAAAALYSSQPNVTHAVKMLEGELDCKLFLRTNKGVQLTPEGELLYSHVAPAMEHLRRAEEELKLTTRLRMGSISIGASEVALHCFLLPILRRFRSAYPGIQIRVNNYSTPQAVRALEEEMVDLAVVTTPVEPRKNLSQFPLRKVQEVAVCSPGLGLFPARPITPKELSEYPLISLSRDTMTYGLYEEWFRVDGLPFHPDIEAATADQILPLVKNDLGIGFVPEDFVARETGSVRQLELTRALPARTICLLEQQTRPLSPAARKFRELVTTEGESKEKPI